MTFFTKHVLLWLPEISGVLRWKSKGVQFSADGCSGLCCRFLWSVVSANVSWKLQAKVVGCLLICHICLRSFSCTRFSSCRTAHIPATNLLLSTTKWTHANCPPGKAAGLCQLLVHAQQRPGKMTHDLGKWHLAWDKTKKRPGWQFNNMMIGYQGLRTLLNAVFCNIDASCMALLRSKPHHVIASKLWT